MPKSLRRSYILQFGSDSAAKRSAARSENDTSDFGGPAASYGLKNSAVFAVDWKESGTPFAGEAHDQLARYDERLLVGQGDGFPGVQCSPRPAQAGDAHDCGDDRVRVRIGHHSTNTVVAN
jgi:hypothetical protein